VSWIADAPRTACRRSSLPFSGGYDPEGARPRFDWEASFSQWVKGVRANSGLPNPDQRSSGHEGGFDAIGNLPGKKGEIEGFENLHILARPEGDLRRFPRHPINRNYM
jgi:hypothetical protein